VLTLLDELAVLPSKTLVLSLEVVTLEATAKQLLEDFRWLPSNSSSATSASWSVSSSSTFAVKVSMPGSILDYTVPILSVYRGGRYSPL
jgi:hypothetical protein